MDDFTELFSLLATCRLALRRNGNAALNQGRTRGLSIDDIILIEAIDPAEGIQVQALAQRTNRDVTLVSRQVSSLCAQGWLVKRRGKTDGRSWRIALTDRAANALDEAKSQAARVYEGMTSQLSPIEKKELCRMLRTIINA